MNSSNEKIAPALDEKSFAHLHGPECSFRNDDIRTSEMVRDAYRTLANVVKAEDMPLEKSRDGLIKHLVHHKMGTREMCVESYMQFLKSSGCSSRHRHMWEEIVFVSEGSGYDLHWDLEFECVEEFEWTWKAESKRFEWERGDFIYVPPYTIHQHFASSDARLIVISNRIVKEMGFDWIDVLENAPGY
jgi:gentisate 1,2-dioxygenase